ncbi:MAG: tetratricopeptide repeat protein [Kiritimatiellae bacterium]|jgi:tetratricopeptide (TPR) repeat protein|nr:tetratricopeptide repeat protein [Kiritimatiellia bacterium]
MNRLVAVITVFVLALQARAVWYWPFGDEENSKKPPRISELMEPASVLIDEASDLAADGKSKEAVAKYREALAELDRIELENPDRADKPEFASLRNKRAYVNAAIDSMLMSQVKENAKAVAVSDTTELEKKLAAERAAKNGAADDKAKGKTEEREAKKAEAGEEVKAKRKVKAKPAPGAAKSRGEQVAADIAAGEFEAAAIVIGEMLEEKPNGAAALNLKAAMETAQGKYKDAEKTLDRAIMSNPRSHYAYYNMARLVLQTRSDGKMTARRYYETGRAVGGPVDDELEGMVK